jgi:hypothetical protein
MTRQHSLANIFIERHILSEFGLESPAANSETARQPTPPAQCCAARIQPIFGEWELDRPEPFGQQSGIASHKEDVAPEDMKRRQDTFFGKAAGQH